MVVPTHRRPHALAKCLDALARQRYPRDRYEVVVVDDGTGSELEPVVRPRRREMTLRLIAQPNLGPAVARNRGAAAAHGRFLAFTDDDCEPADGWLRALSSRLERTPGAMLGGPIRNALPENPYSTASQMLIGYLYQWYNRDPEAAVFFCSNNLALSAERFERIGGFRTMGVHAAAEDRDLCDRWREAGYRMAWVPDAVVCHAHALDLGRFWQQHFQYGRGAFRFHRERRRRNRGFSIEPPSFYAGLLGRARRASPGSSAARIGVLLALTQVANAGGFIVEACATRLRGSDPRRPEAAR